MDLLLEELVRKHRSSAVEEVHTYHIVHQHLMYNQRWSYNLQVLVAEAHRTGAADCNLQVLVAEAHRSQAAASDNLQVLVAEPAELEGAQELADFDYSKPLLPFSALRPQLRHEDDQLQIAFE